MITTTTTTTTTTSSIYNYITNMTTISTTILCIHDNNNISKLLYNMCSGEDNGGSRGEAPRSAVRYGSACLPHVQQHPLSVGLSGYTGAYQWGIVYSLLLVLLQLCMRDRNIEYLYPCV